MWDWMDLGLCWVLGLQFIFWGFNGFFHWKSIPPSPPFIEHFSEACVQSKFIMPLVKILEIVGGVLLLTKYYAFLGLYLLAPIVVVISGLHWFHNQKKSWQVLLPISLPFAFLLIIRFEDWKNLFLR